MQRVFPAVADRFEFRMLERRPSENMAFLYEAREGRVTVWGTDAVAMCRGAYTYLRRAGAAQVTWSGTTLALPSQHLPEASSGVVECPYRWVLQDNVCVFGYTTAYYGWKEWERYLDVMAIHGVNMQFAPIGGEAIWSRIWTGLGIPEEELKSFFTGLGFLPWHRMGNINKHGGPLPKSYFPKSISLQKKILARMRGLGIEPVAPAFAGFVPSGFAVRYPGEKVIPLESWAGFEGEDKTWILHPLSRMYQLIGSGYIKEWKKEFGSARFFLADSFNELEVPVSDQRTERLRQLEQFGRAVYEGIQAGSADGTWVMQGWLFVNARSFWDAESVQALLRLVPSDKMLILDLFAEAAPQWKSHKAFYGKPWVLSTITTWGGNNQAYGDFERYRKLSSTALSDSKRGRLHGFGISFEGSESNEVLYELLCDSAWQKEAIALEGFLRDVCVKDRYGAHSKDAEDAWSQFSKSIYAMPTGMHPNHLIQSRPRDLGAGASGPVHDSEVFVEGVDALARAHNKLGHNPLYRADLLQLTAQWGLIEADRQLALANMLMALGQNGKSIQVQADRAMELARRLIVSCDRLLASHPIDRLDRWIGLARGWGADEKEADHYAMEAKRLITTWGGPVLSEYAAKMWAGLLREYYLPRWQQWMFFRAQGKPFDLFAWEEKWIQESKSSPSTPYSNPVEAAVEFVKFLSQVRKARLASEGSLWNAEPIGVWRSGEQDETYRVRDWDITNAIRSNGRLAISFQYTRGSHRLDIDGVEVLRNGKTIGQDSHFGRTGLEHVANMFLFDIQDHSPGDEYTLRAKVRSDGGSDSNGAIFATQLLLDR